jgi:CubicO group peptidase (beta-lactamase class C family)
LFREPQRGYHFAEVTASNPTPLPEAKTSLDAVIVGAGRTMTLEEFVELTSTTALLIVVDGVLRVERYAAGVAADDRLLGNSATKSALATLVGMALIDGRLADLDAEVCEHVPELAGSGYERVTVRHLLTMTTGIEWLEDYHDPQSVASRLIGRWRDGVGGMRDVIAELRQGEPPGTRYAYCSPDSQVLDWVRERATGQPFAEALSQLWRALGAEQPATIGLDAPSDRGGVAIAAGAMAAAARDWARIGMLQIDGAWNGERVLDPSWVDASSRPSLPFLRPGRLPSRITAHAGFGYQWWPLDDAGARVTADGMRGQFVYVDRPRRTVVVKMSAWPYDDPWWDRQCRDLCYLALPAIAEAAAATS